MKIWIFLILCLSSVAFGQINKDMPVLLGASDKVYQSTADATVAYMFPTKLETMNEPYITEVDGEYRIFFDVGVNPLDLKELSDLAITLKLPVKIRLMRVERVTFDQLGPQEIAKKFRAKLASLGDAGDLAGPVPYLLTIKKIGPQKGLESQKVIDSVFHSSRATHLGTFAYEFNAASNGVHYFAKSAISIFAINHKVKKISMIEKEPEPDLSFQYDAISHCWDHPAVAVICLK